MVVNKRITVFALLVTLGSFTVGAESVMPVAERLSILETGAVADGKTLNTESIQGAIDTMAGKGGGTVVVPKGRFLTGAIFLKPKANLLLEKEAVLMCSTNIVDYPEMPTRIEGHEDIHVRDITINHKGLLVSIAPWAQYFDLKGQPAPAQLIENITISRVSGATDWFGTIAGPEKSVLRNITLEDIDVTLKNPGVTIKNVDGLKVKNVKINGVPYQPEK